MVLVLAAVCIQMRMIAGMVDGMVALQTDKASPSGALWSELSDRVADVLFLAAAGYGASAAGMGAGAGLGWTCAALALLTAFIRMLGRALAQPADFAGPMAKRQRMTVLTVACLVAAFEPLWLWHGQSLLIGLGVIALGSLATIWRRTRRLAMALDAAQHGPAEGASGAG